MPELRLSFRRTLRQPADTPGQVDDVQVLAASDVPAIAGLLQKGAQPFELRQRTWDASSIRWYLEEYVNFPVGGFRFRATEVERDLLAWSERLLLAALGADVARLVAPLLGGDAVRYLTIEAESSAILTLPWELASLEKRTLLERGVIVRRRALLPEHQAVPCARQLRVLLVVSRPDDAGYLDHCRTAAILDDIARKHDGRLEVDLCVPATVAHFEAMLARADQQHRPYGVVHFDGHGDYNAFLRSGELCFEQEQDAQGRVSTEAISGEAFGSLLERYTRPALLVFEACQTAQVTPPLMGPYAPMIGSLRELKAWALTALLEPKFGNAVDLAHIMSPEALRENEAAFEELGLGAALNERDMADVPAAQSFVGAALAAGVESVVGMSHSVHVDATAAFVHELYRALASGRTVGEAVDRGRFALRSTKTRRAGIAAGTRIEVVELMDWFAPQLWQREEDRPLEPVATPAPAMVELSPSRGYGESLLSTERSLRTHRAVLLRGLAGTGKTLLARSLSNWLVRAGQFRDGVLWWSTSDAPVALPAGWAELPKWLAEHDALLVIDGIEGAMSWNSAPGAGPWDAKLRTLVRECLAAQGSFAGRLLMTARFGRNNPLTADGVETFDLPGLDLWTAHEMLERQLAARGQAESWRRLDDEVRIDLLTRLSGNPRLIETAAARWPNAAHEASPESIDDWMRTWAQTGFDAATSEDLGLAAGSLQSLSPIARRLTAVLPQLRTSFALALLGRLQGPAPEEWVGIVDEWARFGLVEPTGGEPPVHRMHPWLPYRLAQDVEIATQASALFAQIYGALFLEVEQLRPMLVPGDRSGYRRWLGAEWGTLRLQLAQALEQNDPPRALSVGLLIDELLAAAGLDKARLRLIHALEPSQRQREALDALEIGMRLRTCDWTLANNQRNDAVAIAAGTLIELEKTDQTCDPAAFARVMSDLASVFRQAGYLHAGMVLYCRACATLLAQTSSRETGRSEAFQLMRCFGQIHEALIDSNRFEQAWRTANRQHVAACGAVGGGKFTLEPVVRLAQTLVKEQRLHPAETLLTTLLGDTEFIDERMLAAHFDCCGDLAGWRKRFDHAAQMCSNALRLYEGIQECRAVIGCHRNMGAICLQTGRLPEAKAWLQAGLEMAWRRADADWAEALLTLLQKADETLLHALLPAGLTNEFTRLSAESQAYLDIQHAKLRGLQEYRAEADAWVSRAVGFTAGISPASLPKDFNVAAEIRRRRPAGTPDASVESTPQPIEEELDQSLTPADPQARTTAMISMIVISAILNPGGAAPPRQ